MTESTKQNPFVTAWNRARKYERPILITTTVVSTTLAVVMNRGIAQHNAFLREHGLFETFYNLTSEA